ncbi:MAG: energy transducer TonB [Bacteroidales bacterium]|nr:energy transducer TonB [Bacteroidales bacterium]
MKRLSQEDKAGLYITAIIHLAVIIILLASQIGYSIQRENTFVLDFTKQEEKEKIERQEQLREDVAEQLDRLLQAAGSVPIRNVAVDRSSLKDDRGTNAEELYRDAERLAKELRDGQNQAHDDDFVDITPDKPDKNTQTSTKTYSGPSVLSWSLDGRKASKLPIPAYRCMGAGQVTVVITVDNAGNVINAKVDGGISSSDGCLQSFAVRAARLSKFSASQSAPARQMGTITYLFIAQ